MSIGKSLSILAIFDRLQLWNRIVKILIRCWCTWFSGFLNSHISSLENRKQRSPSTKIISQASLTRLVLSQVPIFDWPRVITGGRNDEFMCVLSKLLISGPRPPRSHKSGSPTDPLGRPYLIVVLIIVVILLLIKVFIVNDKWRLCLVVLTLVELLLSWPWDWLSRNGALLSVHLLETCPQMLSIPRVLVLWIHLDHRLKL
jgi:hypothetical protein